MAPDWPMRAAAAGRVSELQIGLGAHIDVSFGLTLDSRETRRDLGRREGDDRVGAVGEGYRAETETGGDTHGDAEPRDASPEERLDARAGLRGDGALPVGLVVEHGAYVVSAGPPATKRGLVHACTHRSCRRC